MQHAIKALLGQKKSQREIARQLGAHRDVVRRLIKQIEAGEPPGSYHRGKKLDGYEKLLEANGIFIAVHKKIRGSSLKTGKE